MNRKKPTLVPVSLRALTQRINRKLASERQRLVVGRGKHELDLFGDYYVRGERGVILVQVDVEALGRKLGALKPWQRLCVKES